MTRPPIIRAFLGDDEIVVDLFAGGGGASTGIHRATGRSPDIAINHSPEAIALHEANHPTTKHYLESVYAVDPRRAAGGRPVALLWLSPDCTHHSKAKGGKPRNQKLRGLAWSAIPWAQHCRPRVIVLENVEEWIDWGPVDLATGQPIKARKGQTFRAWRRKLESYGYIVEHRLLRACDYGAPTTRRRLFLIARCDGKPIAWPEPSHGRVASGASRQLELGARAVKPWRTAAEIIDWSIPVPSIFGEDGSTRHADKTLARIAHGLQRFVLDSPSPFVVRGPDGRQFIPFMVHRSNGERVGQSPRVYDINRPVGTIVAQGQKHALCVAFLVRHYGARATGGWNGGLPLTAPVSTITTKDHHALVAAFLIRYNGTSIGQPVDHPLSTIDTRDRFGLVTVSIDGATYTIDDLAMRLFSARELFRAQGFPDSYVIDPIGPNGKPLSKTAQVRACGNAVPPDFVEAIMASTFARAA